MRADIGRQTGRYLAAKTNSAILLAGGSSPARCKDYSGWYRASVLPSGSLNHADLPMPGLVKT